MQQLVVCLHGAEKSATQFVEENFLFSRSCLWRNISKGHAMQQHQEGGERQAARLDNGEVGRGGTVGVGGDLD